MEFILAFMVSLLQPAPAAWDPRAVAAIDRLAAALQKVEGLAYTFHKQERLRGGEVIKLVLAVKLDRAGDLYMRQLSPKNGPELVFRPAKNRDKMTVHPGHFPDFTVNISIWGSLATEDQHHVVTQAGQRYILELIQRAMREARAEPAGESMTFQDQVVFQGQPAERVVLRAGTRPHRRLKAREDESVYAFAARAGCDPYQVVYLNESVDGLSDELDQDREYLVPSYYGQQVELLLDPGTGLLLQVTVLDFQGHTYEHYTYQDLVVNPPLTDRDFDPDNPAYDF